ncbi:MAG TPA: DsbA family protein [Acetobacteraceae bacterium]|nr:DsbA family protein [Acetobacteraceae bacterium]
MARHRAPRGRAWPEAQLAPALSGAERGASKPRRAAYRHWFERGIGNGGEENLRLALADCGQGDAIDRILALADGDEVAQELDCATEEARGLGLFGSPSFVVGKEVFWGDDHLEDAIRWAKHGRL